MQKRTRLSFELTEIMETEFRVNDSVCNWLEIQASPPCVDVDVGQHDIMM